MIKNVPEIIGQNRLIQNYNLNSWRGFQIGVTSLKVIILQPVEFRKDNIIACNRRNVKCILSNLYIRLSD